MPNHVHGVIWIVARSPVGAQHDAIDQHARRFDESSLDGVVLDKQNAAPLRPVVAPRSLAVIIRSFKARAAKRINRYRGTPGHPVWQRNYYERIIRNEEELNAIRQYIRDNPAKWADDKNNPRNWPPP